MVYPWLKLPGAQVPLYVAETSSRYGRILFAVCLLFAVCVSSMEIRATINPFRADGNNLPDRAVRLLRMREGFVFGRTTGCRLFVHRNVTANAQALLSSRGSSSETACRPLHGQVHAGLDGHRLRFRRSHVLQYVFCGPASLQVEAFHTQGRKVSTSRTIVLDKDPTHSASILCDTVPRRSSFS